MAPPARKRRQQSGGLEQGAMWGRDTWGAPLEEPGWHTHFHHLVWVLSISVGF